MRGIAWASVIAALTLAVGLVLAAAGALRDDWMLVAFGGVVVLAGVGAAMLALREE